MLKLGYAGPDSDTLREIEHRCGKTSVMVRGFNVNQNQVNGSCDSLSEQSRPLPQVEDICAATGSDKGLLEARDHGFYTVDMPNFWDDSLIYWGSNEGEWPVRQRL